MFVCCKNPVGRSRRLPARVCLFLLLCLTAAACIPTIGAAAADAPTPEENGVTAIAETAPDPVAKPVSYGLRVLAAREELVLSDLCGNEITFTEEDICRGLNLSAISGITVTALPDPEQGTLYVGATGAAVGQTIPAEALSLVSFKATGSSPCEAKAAFTLPASGYEITCRFCLLDRINYTPTVALASTVSLEVMTYVNMPAQGSLAAYDPEGDEMTYEIISYASHGRIRLDDRHTGAYTYTPDDGYVGSDSFRYVVRDRYGNYSTGATVSVTVHALPAAVSFADIDGNAAAAAALRLGEIGVMNGIRVGGQDFFRPAQEITRAEFIATAMNAAGVCPDATLSESAVAKLLSGYADADSIPTGLRQTLASALENGYFAGKSGADGKLYLRPDDSISRAEAAVLLSNIIGYAKNTAVNAFADADSLPSWSTEALSSLKSLGILCSADNTAEGSRRMTRGDTAVWLERTMRLMGR